MSSLRILHVEDDPITRDLVRHMLEGEMIVESASSLREAHDRLLSASIPYDVVLSDLNLPDAQGVDAVAAFQPYGLPIVVLSRSTDEDTLQRAATCGAADYVGTLSQDALIRRIRFAHARCAKQRTTPSKSPFHRPRMAQARFDALKPYIGLPFPG